MQQQLVFCDEFGNTGADLFSMDQPVLVYAFVAMLPSSALLASELQGLYQSEGISLGELKSGQLLRSARGRARYKSIGKVLTERRTHVLLSAVEKRYQLCSMIAETYLDPLLHELAPREMRDRRFRQRFADGCYDLLEEARLIDFLAAVRSDDAAEIVALGKRLSATLRLHPDDFVSHAAERIEAIPEAVFRYCQKRAGLPRNSHIPASQYAGFYPGLQCVEGYLSRIGATAILVRDEDAQFGEALDAAVKWGKEVERLPGAADYGAIPLNHIASHRCASSTEDLV